MYRPLGVVFMGLGITEVDQEGIAEVLRNIAVKALDHGGTDSLVRPYRCRAAPRGRVVQTELSSLRGHRTAR